MPHRLFTDMIEALSLIKTLLDDVFRFFFYFSSNGFSSFFFFAARVLSSRIPIPQNIQPLSLSLFVFKPSSFLILSISI